MKKTMMVVLSVVVVGLVVSGCGQRARQQQVKAMAELKQLSLARMDALSEGKVGAMEDVAAALSIDASQYEATADWANPEAAPDAVILKQKNPAGGQRVVVYADGRAQAVAE